MTARQDFEALMPVPFEHLYEFATPFGGVEHRTSPNQRNGSGPKRSIPVFTAAQMREAIQAADKAATERAVRACEERAAAYRTTKAPGWHEVDHECTQCIAAIRSPQ